MVDRWDGKARQGKAVLAGRPAYEIWPEARVLDPEPLGQHDSVCVLLLS